MSRSPSAALTVRISRSTTRPTARACVVLRPSTAIVTSMSIMSGGRAYDRYCAVAQMTGRSVVRSSASMAAPRPHPPNRKLPPVDTPGTTGSTQRCGLWVGSSPRNCRASMWAGTVAGREVAPEDEDRRMPDTPWLGDACSLVDAFRSGERSPAEELEACLDAIEASELNAFSYLDADGARARAAAADTSLPFGGVPVAVKELDYVAGWPSTEASLVFKDRISDHDSTMVTRLKAAGGANLFGLTTASEFGGLNVSCTKLNGVTGNPWKVSQTAGGSSAGSASAVAGGLAPIATGGDGGGAIRIPAGLNRLFGMKGTAGRIPRGPETMIGPLTVVIGCLARSVRDAARWYDVCSGFDSRDPYSLPRIEGWERDLGTHD